MLSIVHEEKSISEDDTLDLSPNKENRDLKNVLNNEFNKSIVKDTRRRNFNFIHANPSIFNNDSAEIMNMRKNLGRRKT